MEQYYEIYGHCPECGIDFAYTHDQSYECGIVHGIECTECDSFSAIVDECIQY